MYLAVVMDLYSWAIVGWSLDTHMRESLISDAFDMAVARRDVPERLIVHSHRGVQYRSHSDRLNIINKNWHFVKDTQIQL